jgi:hypothetical protein
MDQFNIPYCLLKDLPQKLEGLALAICEEHFFSSRTAWEVKQRGLKLVWSNEMMWEFADEKAAVKEGIIDKVLFVSEFQARAFERLYNSVPAEIVGNYISPAAFSFIDRRHKTFTVGRLSRSDTVKFPEDFPVFYEELGLSDVKFRVMAWDDKLRKKYRWHKFGDEWDLLPQNKESALKFLQSLDLFIYPLGHTFKESWGRSVVEGMLTGCIPLVPAGHQFHNSIIHGETGFICNDFEEYRGFSQRLYRDFRYRNQISRQASEYARNSLCNEDLHREVWLRALTT